MSTYVLPQTDPSLPANASPLFSDIVANRGDHFRANNSCIWQNFLALAALFAASGHALNADQVGGYSIGNATGQIPVSNGTANVNLNASLLSGSTLSTDGTFAANSDTLIASQKATNTRIGHPATLFKNVDYVITDTDQVQNVNFDTTAGNRLCTLPLIANNVGRRIRVANVKGGTNFLTVSPNATDANKLSLDGLASIILPKVGDYVEFQASSDTGFWEIISEKITCVYEFDTYAGYGSTDTCIMKFTNNPTATGNMLSTNYSSYGVHGLIVTIQKKGNYFVEYNGQAPSGATLAATGISVNSNQLSTNITAIALANRKAVTIIASTGIVPNAICLPFSKNDFICAHTDGSTPYTAALCQFKITYMG